MKRSRRLSFRDVEVAVVLVTFAVVIIEASAVVCSGETNAEAPSKALHSAKASNKVVVCHFENPIIAAVFLTCDDRSLYDSNYYNIIVGNNASLSIPAYCMTSLAKIGLCAVKSTSGTVMF